MMADKVVTRRPGRWALLGAVALSLAASGALAQGPPSGPPPGGFPAGGPPSGGLPPGGPPGGAGAPGAPPGAAPGAPPGAIPSGGPPPEPLTPAQELVKSAGPSPGGGFFPHSNPSPDAPPPGADPRDIRGTWYHSQALEFRMARDMYGNPAPYTMKGAQIVVRRMKGDRGGKPYTNLSAKCRPPGPQWQHDLNMPFSIFVSKNWIEILFEEYHGRWEIVLDPAAAPPPAEKAYMGYSVGHWEGNTLVVETKDFKEPLWLDVEGTPLSANGKLIHRIRKVDNGDNEPFLEMITTINDPAYYTKPWSVVRTFGWTPDQAYHKEYNCEEQIGDRSVDADAGLLPEPKE